MNLKEIVESWLKDNEYDGLYANDGSCACKLGDLMPCDEPEPLCEPGYLAYTKCDPDVDFYITQKKESAGYCPYCK